MIDRMKKHRTGILLGIILLIGIFARFYKMEELAVFLADQASDSTQVRNMLSGDFTLLGPISSVGGFYNGPIVYYLMVPFYWLFQAQPVAGTVFQSSLQVGTIILLYFFGRKVKNESVGLLAAFLFAVSPLMIDYSRAAFNSYPAVFFSTLILYLYLFVLERFSLWKCFVMGILLGCIMQMHYLSLSLVVLVVLYPVLFQRNLVSFRYYGALVAGIVVGLSPFLLFEVRHQFLNIQLFIQYVFSEKKTVRSIVNVFQVWPEVTGWLLFGHTYWQGLLGFVTIAATSCYLYLKTEFMEKKYLKVFGLLFVFVFLLGLLYGGKMQTHYIVNFHTSLILLSAIALYYLAQGKRMVIGTVCAALFVLNIFAWNVEKDRHPLQESMAIRDFKAAAGYIRAEQSSRGLAENYNVGMFAQNDSRAMPLRYTLEMVGEKPEPYTNYASIDTLYFVVPADKRLKQLTMWEYTAFGKSTVEKSWPINEKMILYKLRKASKNSLPENTE